MKGEPRGRCGDKRCGTHRGEFGAAPTARNQSTAGMRHTASLGVTCRPAGAFAHEVSSGRRCRIEMRQSAARTSLGNAVKTRDHMAAMVALSPSIVEGTSNEPHIRQYYGDALLRIPGPEELRNSITRALCCTAWRPPRHAADDDQPAADGRGREEPVMRGSAPARRAPTIPRGRRRRDVTGRPYIFLACVDCVLW